MSHARKVIRDYVETTLAPVGLPVYKGRVWLIDTSDLPAIDIATAEEQSGEQYRTTVPGTPAPYLHTSELVVTVQVRAIAMDDILDVLDGYAADIQARLSEDISWGATCLHVRLEGVTTELSREFESPVGVLTMGWQATYRVDMRNPAIPV